MTAIKNNGNKVGIEIAAGPNVGFIDYRLDKKEWKELNLLNRWKKHLHLL
ncbi:hypothetical protein GCM10007383_35510 [Arenibacter certesii]|uniref:Uncharacterized protein n=2 Tax=Arenibacter certesii TaxID=228955 RepID=A0A918J4W6_9FLAO|nr:hypothetical protein GCM10007383_35510 [Arenibacter certesii]